MYNLTQKLTAEFLGTFAVVFFAAGAVCADFHLRNSPTGGIGQLSLALAYGLTFAIMFAALGHISGGHFNPAITIGFWVTKRLSTLDTLSYWAAQLLGAFAAAFLLKVVIPDESWRNATNFVPELLRDYPGWAGMALEATATFFLVLVVFATVVDERANSRPVAAFAMGLTITVGVLVAGPFTGAALNPARAFGPALALHHWLNQLIYWVGPLGGGFLAGLVYDSLFLRQADV
jgi:MIP family channel proteins